MKNVLIYPLGATAACTHAAGFLAGAGAALVDHPTPEVTHLLLDVPLRGALPERTLAMLPENVTVIGGNLPDGPHRTLDLLRDEAYLCANAGITAHCALKIAMNNLTVTFDRLQVLVIGWGRIAQCLAGLLRGLGAEVTVTARKARDRAMAAALGFAAADTASLASCIGRFRVVFNTAPEPVVSQEMWREPCLKIDLASRPGLEGSDVITARGLPGIHAPEASGILIGKTILNRLKEEEK